MPLRDLVVFREDLFFDGAVQISWFESDRKKATKAAEYFVFHGPQYHGVSAKEKSSNSGLMDTATFASQIINHLDFKDSSNPFMLAVAGYGTGKSHLGLTLATLLEQPRSSTAKAVLNNVCLADKDIGQHLEKKFNVSMQRYIVVALNGMQDFNLENEIIRQIYASLKREGLDTSPLEALRPRFKTAIKFCENYFDNHIEDFKKSFGSKCSASMIIKQLEALSEGAYRKVNEVYTRGMGSPIQVKEAEDLGRFLQVAKDIYCGPEKTFSGILILFDEFGRYLEFSVHKPQVAGSGSLQKLFEAVQNNRDRVFMVGFIQYEIQAYIARIAPELRVDLERFVDRFNNAETVRLSTNLETLLANLLEKKSLEELRRYQAEAMENPQALHLSLKSWLPEMKNHAVWAEKEAFCRVIYEGCWPLHPTATWLLYKLSSIGRLLQQRSALSFVADAYKRFNNRQVDYSIRISAVDLCNDAMVDELLASEDYGQPGIAHKYEAAMSKYETNFKQRHKRLLKAVLLIGKIGIRAQKDDYERIVAMFSGLDFDITEEAIHHLEKEYGVLEWNPQLRQYEIVGESVSRRAFHEFLQHRAKSISQAKRAEIFSQKMLNWSAGWNLKLFNINYDDDVHKITTQDWDYRVNYADPSILRNQLENMVKQWREVTKVDEEKGVLLYCYVGPDSSLEDVKNTAQAAVRDVYKKLNITEGCPVAIILLHDEDGALAEYVAHYMVLEQLTEAEIQKYGNFIDARKKGIEKLIQDTFAGLVRNRTMVLGNDDEIKGDRLGDQLTSLFENVYKKSIPFPFDGFAGQRGNGGPDCKEFTKDLFTGNLDKERIAQYGVQQRNRAVTVIQQAWGAINLDGTIRQIPQNKNIAEIFTEFDKNLDSKQRMNIGGQLRRICRPPYGCNIASAGMLLALFIGSRKETINVYKDKRKISIEDWLSTAFKNNFLAIPVVDSTEIVKVAEGEKEKWERALEEWENEITYTGKINYFGKIRDLEQKMELPQPLAYRYELMLKNLDDARSKISEWQERVKKTQQLVNTGQSKKNARFTIRAALQLLEIKKGMENREEWDTQQLDMIDAKFNETLVKRIPEIFPVWLAELNIGNIEDSALFRKDMKSTMKDLSNLGLQEESMLLERRTEEVITSVRNRDEWSKLKVNVRDMIRTQIITDSTSVITLETWIRQAGDYHEKIKNMAESSPVAKSQDGLDKAVDEFILACYRQIQDIGKRLKVLSQVKECKSYKDLEDMATESATLISLFYQKQKETSELFAIKSEIDVIKGHYLQLEDMDLDSKQFESSYAGCLRENKSLFHEPPLVNTDGIYESIKKTITEKREGMALIWVNNEVPDAPEIKFYDAAKVMKLIDTLRTPPKLLSRDQLTKVKSALKIAEERASEIEIDTILVRFYSMSSDNKKRFLIRIYDFLKANLDELTSS